MITRQQVEGAIDACSKEWSSVRRDRSVSALYNIVTHWMAEAEAGVLACTQLCARQAETIGSVVFELPSDFQEETVVFRVRKMVEGYKKAVRLANDNEVLHTALWVAQADKQKLESQLATLTAPTWPTLTYEVDALTSTIQNLKNQNNALKSTIQQVCNIVTPKDTAPNAKGI